MTKLTCCLLAPAVAGQQFQFSRRPSWPSQLVEAYVRVFLLCEGAEREGEKAEREGEEEGGGAEGRGLISTHSSTQGQMEQLCGRVGR